MRDLAIRVETISKRYRIGARQKRHDTLRDAIMASFRRSTVPKSGRANEDMIWALKDVSFDIKRGEVVGIIGRNGAGKSTLLKILSRITEPTAGHGEIYGRVGSLLEVGTGFHPELTGRENIYLNGAILGMKKTEIESKLDEIVAFSEVEQFIDTPVKHYSSGMYVRLAFAVAAHLEPEILLVDEVLAVGDESFQRKCLGKMEEVGKEGRTVLFISHNMGSIQHLCTRALLLQNGRIVMDGIPPVVAKGYLSGLMGSADSIEKSFPKKEGNACITNVRFLNPADPTTARVEMASSFSIEIGLSADRPLTNPIILIQVLNQQGYLVFSTYSYESAKGVPELKGDGKLLCHLNSNPLTPGRYYVTVALGDIGQRLDEQVGAICFEVIPMNVYGTGKPLNLELNGVCWIPHRWEFLWHSGTPKGRGL